MYLGMVAAIVTTVVVLLAALVAGCSGPAPASTPIPTPSPTFLPAPAETTAAQPTATGIEARVAAAAPTPPAPTPAPRLGDLTLKPALAGQSLESPTNLAVAADGMVWVSEQDGRIWVFDGMQSGGNGGRLALDITDRVSTRRTEEGLLGLALEPDGGRHLYVYYSAAGPRRSVVSRFDILPGGVSVERDSELVILEVGQPYANHNGGQIAFGPGGHLYIGLGDGGSAGDPQGNGQDTSTLLGSILRIDVSQASPEQRYAIPPDNPLAAGSGGRGEIWAHGLRNPWRFSFDSATGALWAGDVGQNRWEEIDRIERGANYGWNVLEGNHCFRKRDDCDRRGMTPPVWEYPLDGEPCSVIGGYVYRGDGIPWLHGVYVYGDFCSGDVFGLRYEDGRVAEHRRLADTDLRIMSFGQDNGGELYLLSQRDGVYRLAN